MPASHAPPLTCNERAALHDVKMDDMIVENKEKYHARSFIREPVAVKPHQLLPHFSGN